MSVSEEEKKKYMSRVQKIMYLGHDRGDIAFAAKELARWSSSPTQGHSANARHLAGYLQGKMRVCYTFMWKWKVDVLTV